jgi:hypothetical protein
VKSRFQNLPFKFNLQRYNEARGLLHTATAIVTELDANTHWTGKVVKQLDRYDHKMQKLDDVVAANRAAAAAKRAAAAAEMGKEKVLGINGKSGKEGGKGAEAEDAEAAAGGVSSEVKLGVEAVRQWEEKVAHNLTVGGCTLIQVDP